jgi:hypothetical protein
VDTCGNGSTNACYRRTRQGADVPLAKCVDPAVDHAGFAGEDVGVAEALREQRGALDAGEQAEGEVVRVAASELPELLFRPVDHEAKQCFGFALEASGTLP